MRGGSLQKRDFAEIGCPCIHYGQIHTQYGIHTNETISYISADKFERERKAKKGDIIMAVTSETVEDVCKAVAWLGDGEVAVGGHTAIIHHNQNAKYLSYYFNSAHFLAQKRKLTHGEKVKEVKPNDLLEIILPIPTLEKQSEISEKLDQYYDLIFSLTNGLPAEIEARKKQYEYYRDKLLSFQPVRKS